MRVPLVAWALCIGCTAVGSERVKVRAAPAPATAPLASAIGTPGAATNPFWEEPGERAACAAELEQVLAEPELPGASQLDSRRGEIFLRAKADPVLFVRSPAAAPTTEASAAWRSDLEASERPATAVAEILKRRFRHREAVRRVLLPEGYLFSSTPGLAAALTEQVRLVELFEEKELWVARGSKLLRLERRPFEGSAAYFEAEGEEAGARARLFLFDRVATTREALGTPLHRDVSEVARELGFERLRVSRITDTSILVDALYGQDWVPTLLRSEGARLTFGCELIAPGREGAVAEARRETLRARRVLERLQHVIREQVAERLPFDEPRTEIGQEDGKLRQHWGWAYRYGKTQFDYNEDRYRVFDAAGRPRVPQVCIDFIRDTFERASGSWYRPRGQPRERIPGRLDFGALGIDNERSVERFVEFAKAHGEWFDVLELSPDEWVPFAERDRFFDRIVSSEGRYRPGDIVTIYGLRDDQKMHYHSFIVYEVDPVSAVPSLVAANAGRPTIRPWASEMMTAPLRSIRARIRPRLAWLESLFGDAPSTTTAAKTEL